MLNHKSVLITGGTGSFGKKFVETILNRYPEVKRIVIYSRDELKQFELKQKYPHDQYPQLRFFAVFLFNGTLSLFFLLATPHGANLGSHFSLINYQI